MAVFDLDAARAARREAQAEPPTIVFGGETFELPPELELEAAEHLMYGRPTSFVQALLGDDWERFHVHKPTINDLQDLAEGLAVLYGFTSSGESSASSSSSPTTGSQPRPTSSATTASRSQRRATAKKGGSPSGGSKRSSPASPPTRP